MEALNEDLQVPKLTLEDPGSSEDSKISPPNTEALEKFAQNMAEDIIRSFTRQMELLKPEESSSNQGQELLAEDLVAEVIGTALREVCSRKSDDTMGGSGSSRASRVIMDSEKGEILSLVDESGTDNCSDMDTEINQFKEPHKSIDSLAYNPHLPHSGLPAVGSLDYPDAPPTTPLLPELERSRHSFAQKLKGGLAKVFLPSPPPPTPKDKEDTSDGSIKDPHIELMEHLMHSLSTEDLSRDGFEVGPRHGATTEAFAEALSYEITNWVLKAKTDSCNVQLLAHQLAETIISSSIDEVKVLV